MNVYIFGSFYVIMICPRVCPNRNWKCTTSWNNNWTLYNNNITSMGLKSSEARAQKSNKTKSVIIFKSRGHTGVIISFKGPPTI